MKLPPRLKMLPVIIPKNWVTEQFYCQYYSYAIIIGQWYCSYRSPDFFEASRLFVKVLDWDDSACTRFNSGLPDCSSLERESSHVHRPGEAVGQGAVPRRPFLFRSAMSRVRLRQFRDNEATD